MGTPWSIPTVVETISISARPPPSTGEGRLGARSVSSPPAGPDGSVVERRTRRRIKQHSVSALILSSLFTLSVYSNYCAEIVMEGTLQRTPLKKNIKMLYV